MDAGLVLSAGFGVFAICAGLAFFSKHVRAEKEKLELSYTIQRDQQVQDLTDQVEHFKRSALNFQQRLQKVTRNYDVDFEDEELPESANTDELLPAAMNIIGDKLPPSIRPIVNNPKVMGAIVDAVAKNPDILNKVMDLFSKNEPQRPAPVLHGI